MNIVAYFERSLEKAEKMPWRIDISVDIFNKFCYNKQDPAISWKNKTFHGVPFKVCEELEGNDYAFLIEIEDQTK
jgi:hypothetical protein